MSERVELTYKEYAQIAEPADIALWRPLKFSLRSPASWIPWGRYIARYTQSDYCHVTGVVYWSDVDRWMSCGYSESKGGFAEPLDVAVDEQPSGTIDIWRVKRHVWDSAGGDETRSCVAEQLVHMLGHRYAWRSIRLIIGPWLPVLGMFSTEAWYASIIMQASHSKREGICSQHIARSMRGCGLPLVDKPDALVVPGDFQFSYATEYIGTLVK